MSAFQIFTQPSQQALDTAANVLSGATLTFSLTGTSTPTNAFSDSTLATPVANPLSANSAGVWAPIFLDPAIVYRIVLKTAAGAVLQTWDPANENLLSYFLASITQAFIGGILYPRTAAEIAAGVTPVNLQYPECARARYGSQADLLTVGNYIVTNFPSSSLNTVRSVGYGVFGNGLFNTNNATADPPHILEIVNDNSPDQCLRFNSYGIGAFGNNVHYCRYFGTQAAPTVIGLLANIMSSGFRGYTGVELSQSAAAFQCQSVEAWSASAQGCRFHFEVTAPGSTALSRLGVMDITSAGVCIGTGSTGLWDTTFRVLEFSAGTAVRANDSAGLELVLSSNSRFNGGSWKYGLGGAAGLYTISANVHVWHGAPIGVASAAVTFTEFGRFDASGNLLVGANGAAVGRAYHNLLNATAEGNTILLVRSETTANTSIQVQSVAADGHNAAAAALFVGKNNSTSRSINAGGTVNASGADYAEYLRKTDGCGVIEKGAICGITAKGELTDKWAEAVSFCVKSTDPSYVGGDAWGAHLARPELASFEEPAYEGAPNPGPEPVPLDEERGTDHHMERLAKHAGEKSAHEADRAVHEQKVRDAKDHYDSVIVAAHTLAMTKFETELETCRRTVDRIAFAGQVPCNVRGANPGDYIVPVQVGDAISGAPISKPTFEQYQQAVGKVIALEPDSRARIIVKVA